MDESHDLENSLDAQSHGIRDVDYGEKISHIHHTGITSAHTFVENLSSLLDRAGILNLVWGKYRLTAYGVPSIVPVSIYSANSPL